MPQESNVRGKPDSTGKPDKPPKPPHGGGKPDDVYVPPAWIPIPTGLTVNATSPKSAALSWNAVSDPNPVYYWVYRTDPSGIEYVVTINNLTTYTDPSLAAGETYKYQVAAVVLDPNNDYLSTLGGKCEAVSVTTPAVKVL
jgi:fibronectin type 3 domain-containing protein